MRLLIALPMLLILNSGSAQNVPDSVWRTSWVKSQKVIDQALVSYRNHAIVPIYKEMGDKIVKAKKATDNGYLTRNKDWYNSSKELMADFSKLYTEIKSARKDLITQRKTNKSGPFTINKLDVFLQLMQKIVAYFEGVGLEKELAKYKKATNALPAKGADYISIYTVLQDYYGVATRTERALANQLRNKME